MSRGDSLLGLDDPDVLGEANFLVTVEDSDDCFVRCSGVAGDKAGKDAVGSDEESVSGSVGKIFFEDPRSVFIRVIVRFNRNTGEVFVARVADRSEQSKLPVNRGRKWRGIRSEFYLLWKVNPIVEAQTKSRDVTENVDESAALGVADDDISRV